MIVPFLEGVCKFPLAQPQPACIYALISSGVFYFSITPFIHTVQGVSSADTKFLLKFMIFTIV